MRVFDLVKASNQRRGMRVAVIGSCRVFDPFEALADCGRATRVWANLQSTIYTFGEAEQVVRYTRGDIDLPEKFWPYIFFDRNLVVARTDLEKRVLDTVDVVFVEISDLREIRHGPFYFQINYFYQEFVSKYGAPLLPWYRAFSLQQDISDKLVAETLEKFADHSDVERDAIEQLLRHTRIERSNVEKSTKALNAMIIDHDKRWVLVSHFAVPGLGGTLMKDRIELIDLVSKVASGSGVGMLDPSELLAQHGREMMLRNEGRDIYHYNPQSHELVSEALLKAADLMITEDRTEGVEGDHAGDSATAAAAAVNGVLLKVHQERAAVLGDDASGLFAHYRRLLDAGRIADKAIADLADLISQLLPRFDCYHVLRAGLGELAFVLAALGLRTGAFDSNPNRFAAISAGFTRLCDSMPEVARELVIGRAGVPDVPEIGRTLGVAHHLIGYSENHQEEVLAQLASYSALLVNPRIFLYARPSVEEQQAIIEVLRKRGFTRIRDYPQLGVVYCAKPDAHA